MIRIIFGLIEVLVGFTLLVMFAPAFLGDRIPYPLDWINAMVPAISFNGGFIYGCLSIAWRAIVLVVIVAVAVGSVRVASSRFR